MTLPKTPTLSSAALALLLAALAPATAAAQAASVAPTPGPQPFSAERSWQLARIGAPAVSPDGRLVLAPVGRPDLARDKVDTDLWLWNRDGSGQRAFTADPSSEGSPRFSPDGQLVAFTAQRAGDTAPQLYVMPVAGGEARRLTTLATGVASPKWYDDGRRLAFTSLVWEDLPLDGQQARIDERAAATMRAQVYDGTPVSSWDVMLDDRAFHVFAVDLERGQVIALTAGSGLALPRNATQGTDALFDIAPGGRELAFVADSDPAGNRADLDVYTLALGEAGARPRNLSTGNEGSDGNPLYSPDGRHLAWLQQRVPGFYAAKARLMLHDRRGGATRELYADWDRSAGGLVWAHDGRQLFGAIDDAGTQRVYALPLDGQPRAITRDSSFSGLATARDGQLYALRQTFIEPPTLVRINPRDGAVAKLSTINDALLADTALGTYESVTYEGADGQPIQMWVNYPPGFDRSRQYPVFVLIHGGPHNAITDGMAFRWNAQVFGSWGYVTAWPNFHGSSGFGEAFTDAINPDWTTKPYEDVIRAADWLRAQPWADGERMVAGGGSYGGYLTTVLLGREHPFKALVAHAAVYNLYTQYAADFATQRPRFGGFWEEGNRAVIEATSPHYRAGHFRTPTLVVHGQRDLRVPVNHGLELYQTLLMQGVPTRFVYFPDENHWVLKPRNSVFWYDQVRAWLAEHIDGPAPSAAPAAGPGPAAVAPGMAGE
jgi:dipeptidyl aminopeptidase/acylaminoacyl peptidase